MKLFKILLFLSFAILVVSSSAIARDFDWTRDFNVQAKADPAGFRKRIAIRFGLSDLQAIALRNIFYSPADAYIMLKFGEIKGVLNKLSKEEGVAAIKKYKSNKKKGWNTLAEILGVDTKCEEYLALKRGHDLHDDNNRNQLAYSKYARNNVN